MLKRWFSRLKGEQKGFTFIEVLVGIAIMGMIVAVFLMAIATAFKANATSQIRTTADSLARAQMEYVQNQEYRTDYYEPLQVIPQNYSIWSFDADNNIIEAAKDDIAIIEVDDGLQKIKLLIKHNDIEVLTLEKLKARR